MQICEKCSRRIGKGMHTQFKKSPAKRIATCDRCHSPLQLTVNVGAGSEQVSELPVLKIRLLGTSAKSTLKQAKVFNFWMPEGISGQVWSDTPHDAACTVLQTDVCLYCGGKQPYVYARVGGAGSASLVKVWEVNG